ncbi:unnamed protein product [Calypogeia fissa]
MASHGGRIMGAAQQQPLEVGYTKVILRVVPLQLTENTYCNTFQIIVLFRGKQVAGRALLFHSSFWTRQLHEE